MIINSRLIVLSAECIQFNLPIEQSDPLYKKKKKRRMFRIRERMIHIETNKDDNELLGYNCIYYLYPVLHWQRFAEHTPCPLHPPGHALGATISLLAETIELSISTCSAKQ